VEPSPEAIASSDDQSQSPGIRPPVSVDQARRRRFRRAAAGALAAVAVLAAAAFAAVTVTPWQPPSVEWFNPKFPPPDLGKDGGDCVGKVEWTGGDPLGSYSDVDSTYILNSIGDVELTGSSHIRLPTTADSVLVDHEDTHDRLFKYEYDKRAKKKMEAAIRRLTGRVFKGEGATGLLRVANAKNKARAARDSALGEATLSIKRQMSFLGDVLDIFTEHGTSGTCTSTAAESLAMGKWAKAPPAGTTQKTQDPTKKKVKGAPVDRFMYLDPDRLLAFAGAGTIAETTDPADPILGRGRVTLEPFAVIGPLEDGSTYLSDTRLMILDTPTGDTLLVAYVLEAACVTTGTAGEEATVQAHLAIPPLWAGGVRNTIGSQFLGEMGVASETNEETTLWLHAPLPLFDSTGVCLIPVGGVPATFTIGFGWPPTNSVEDAPSPKAARLAVSPQPGTGAVRFAWAPLRGTVRLELFDVSGARRRAAAVDGAQGAWVWDGADDQGQAVPAGIYFAKLKAPGIELKCRVVRIR
jgi:hypothetical protein